MIACIAAGFGCLFAQDTRTVKGVVISSEDNLPVIGAAVMEKGTKNATMTDIDGKFTLKVRLSAKTLEISCLGMKPKDVGITDGEMRISLEADTEVLEGVVVTGMQKMDKRLFTGATSKLSAEDVKLDGVAEISRALEGRAAGVSVQNVSGTFGTSLRSGSAERPPSMAAPSLCGLWTA